MKTPGTTLESPFLRRLMMHSVNRLSLAHLCAPLVDSLSDVVVTEPDLPITGLTADSRAVVPGDLFVAAPGSQVDGLDYWPQALAKGAVAVLASVPVTVPEGVGFVGVPDVAAAKPLLADRFFGHPSGRLKVVGITGTNGKTTTAEMLRSILTMDGRDSGLVGTLGAWIGNTHEPLCNTTPDAIELQRLLARMVDANLSTAVLEVSSHALSLGRVGGVDFDVGVFTNLTQDHLDFHGTMEDYADAKARLFEQLMPDAVAVLNADDALAPSLAERTLARVLTFGLDQPAAVSADVRRLDADGTAFQLRVDERNVLVPVTTRLVGRHNVSNALAASAAALALDVPSTAIRAGLSTLSAVPGRLESVDCGQDFRVLVDYAHTPDALQQVLTQLRPLTRGRLRVVFGCGGDRDKTKRPLMGATVAALADDLYVTSDNPRGEDPQRILDDILEGLSRESRQRAVSLVDRREAIAAACRSAQGGDIVLVAGKGHEVTQTIAGEKFDFDDRAVTREVLWTL
ncbi:MAG: UDP-N-acetylmuramoyl-L-alanyl-D-glutamate--2,6-diaminopimelate ligase [Pseudohongiellaceae bacterium]|jgi:UDP-N-acetylmuramoyl-L-alanyl-D-glutamate--2,6-diaminopimelate ligase